MYILQISDLHLSSDSDIENLLNKIGLLCGKINQLKDEKNSQIVCCVLGDFVDKGDSKAFDNVKSVLDSLREALGNYFGSDNVAFVLLPGNHDLCETSQGEKTLANFNNFRSQFLNYKINDELSSSVEEVEKFGYSFLSVNSVFKNQHDYGQIDFRRLKETIKKPQQTILLTHHALISSDDEDTAAIRSGHNLLKFIQENKIIALLHGHTHGCKHYIFGKDQQIVGVGPMFKNVEDVSNECNLIHIAGRCLRKITTLTYHGDRQCWDDVEIYRREQDSNYFGSSVYDVYSNVLEDAKINYFLPNLKIEIKQDFASFEKEIKTKFNNALEQAELWQKESPEESLEYTHCQLMNYENRKWDDFIVETLTENPTSKRALIPLIDKPMVFKGGDDRLVSFDVVQFGFSNEKRENLNITIYLRALEIQYFLPLNICETYIMAKKMYDAFRSINEVTICIFAFRGEAKDEYGCYRKSKLDVITESEVCKLFSDRNIAEIQNLLSQKVDMGDTVINKEWLSKIKNAVSAFCGENQEILNQIIDVENNLEEYKKVRRICSNYFTTKPQEENLNNSINKLAALMETLN